MIAFNKNNSIFFTSLTHLLIRRNLFNFVYYFVKFCDKVNIKILISVKLRFTKLNKKKRTLTKCKRLMLSEN